MESGLFEWAEPESNRRHQDFQSCALPTELPVQEPPIIWKTPSVASANEALPVLSIFANTSFPPNGPEPFSKRLPYGRTTPSQPKCQADPKRRCGQAAQIPAWLAHLPTSKPRRQARANPILSGRASRPRWQLSFQDVDIYAWQWLTLVLGSGLRQPISAV